LHVTPEIYVEVHLLLTMVTE